MAKRLRIGIVGGGIAGCAAALLLARDGHDVELFEQAPHIGPVGAGILVQPSGQAVLRELGLLDAVVARAARIEALVAWTHHGRRLSHLAYADHTPGMHALGVHRPDLFGVLHDACLAAGVRLRLAHAIDGTRRVGNGRQLSSREQIVGTYELVLAADGSRSCLRAASGLRAFVYTYRSAALWAVGRSDSPQRELVQFTRSNRELCGLLPMGGGRCSFFWGVDHDDLARLRRSSIDAWRDRVLSLAPMAEPLVRPIRGWNDLMYASYRAVLMPRVTGDRLAFIGDAAHAAGPHLGQGVNLALLDALALRDSIRAGLSLAEALQRFERSERLRNVYYSGVTAALMPTFQGPSIGLGPARDIALPLLQRVRPLRRLMLQTLCGVR